MSNELRKGLIDELVEAVRMHQNAVDAVDEAASRYLGVNRTDMRCLDIIDRKGGATPGELARESGLTTGAITAAIDRLEVAEYVTRVRDPVDRRRVLVKLTDKARQRTMDCYGPIAAEGIAGLAAYSEDQLSLIRDFLRAGQLLLSDQAVRLRRLSSETRVQSQSGERF
jgi:DNA-binding MarR family transcriptional regulator